MNIRLVKIFCLSALIFPARVLAHSVSSGEGFTAGFLHPLLGLDHFLAMLSVGIISAQFGGRFVWLVPTLFVLFMVIGETLGANGVDLPLVEIGIASSVIVLGVGISVAHYKKFYAWLIPLTMLFVIIFGSLHGHAHGVEMPHSESPIYYIFGFIVSTSLIHLLGVFIGFIFTYHDKLKRIATPIGILVAGAGCYILTGL